MQEFWADEPGVQLGSPIVSMDPDYVDLCPSYRLIEVLYILSCRRSFLLVFWFFLISHYSANSCNFTGGGELKIFLFQHLSHSLFLEHFIQGKFTCNKFPQFFV